MNDSRAASPATEARQYRYWSVEHIRFADLDLVGHVNNVAFTVYAESSRVAFLRESRLWEVGSAVNNVVARIELDYRRELRFPGDVQIGVRVLRIGNSSYTLGQGFFSDGECAATVVTTLVRFDAQTRRSMPLDEASRQKLLAYLNPDPNPDPVAEPVAASR